MKLEWDIPSTREQQALISCVQKAVQVVPAVSRISVRQADSAYALVHVEHLPPVQGLHISCTTCMAFLPNLTCLPALQDLWLQGVMFAKDRENLQHMQHLTSLHTLRLDIQCGNPDTLASALGALAVCASLRSFELISNRRRVPLGTGIAQLSQLTELKLVHCTITMTAKQFEMNSIRKLTLDECSSDDHCDDVVPAAAWPQLSEVHFIGSVCAKLVHYLALPSTLHKLREVTFAASHYSEVVELHLHDASTMVDGVVEMLKAGAAKELSVGLGDSHHLMGALQRLGHTELKVLNIQHYHVPCPEASRFTLGLHGMNVAVLDLDNGFVESFPADMLADIPSCVRSIRICAADLKYIQNHLSAQAADRLWQARRLLDLDCMHDLVVKDARMTSLLKIPLAVTCKRMQYSAY